VCTAPTWIPEEAARLRGGEVLRTRVEVPATGTAGSPGA
jgi:hypothetical protein